ncbi:HYC_CC_PP family protein [Empedobacter brevis]|uniref:HYC_CC_PP family protein n=1 Tax=Empedobacter brevis TaxID=247 RepID=UPI00289D12DB|nr:hypothetical protein [Empedobacter brevis]
MMKKLLVIFFSLFYLVVASGFTQYTHLCKGAARTVYSLTNTKDQNQNKPCPICSAKEKGLKKQKKNCCEHLFKLIKVNDSVKKQNNYDFSVKFWNDVIPGKMLGTVFDLETTPLYIHKNDTYTSSKVPIQDTSIYILHCVYRI